MSMVEHLFLTLLRTFTFVFASSVCLIRCPFFCSTSVLWRSREKLRVVKPVVLSCTADGMWPSAVTPENPSGPEWDGGGGLTVLQSSEFWAETWFLKCFLHFVSPWEAGWAQEWLFLLVGSLSSFHAPCQRIPSWHYCLYPYIIDKAWNGIGLGVARPEGAQLPRGGGAQLKDRIPGVQPSKASKHLWT